MKRMRRWQVGVQCVSLSLSLLLSFLLSFFLCVHVHVRTCKIRCTNLVQAFAPLVRRPRNKNRVTLSVSR